VVGLPLCSTDAGTPRINHLLDGEDAGAEARVLGGVSTIVRGRVSVVNGGEPSILEKSDEERDEGPVQATKRRRLDQTDSVLDTGCSNESPISATESSGRTLVTASASGLSGISNNGPVMAALSDFKITKIIGKQGSQQAKTHAYEMYAIWELHACEMAYGRGTHMRGTPMR
jgi:hypothetical protein